MVKVRTAPVGLHWADASSGKRVLYVGNQPAPVAEIEYDGLRVSFSVFLPGQSFQRNRPFASRSAAEAFVYGVVEAWFREIFA